MDVKKKILLTAGIGTAAVIAGVAPAIASVASIQSSVIDDVSSQPVTPVEPINPVEPVVPDNPTEPIEPIDPNVPDDPIDEPPVELLVATAPSNDIFVYDIKLSQLNNVYLNEYLKKLFATEDFYKETFINADEYSNVNVSYVENSANFSNSTFEISVSPIDGAIWENETDVEKTVEVTFDNDIKIANATIPKKTITYKAEINAVKVTTDSDFNTYLSNLFKINPKITDFTIVNGDVPFSNVDLTYVNNSASLKNKTFKIKATPVRSCTWSPLMGEISDTVQLEVKIGNIITADKAINLPSSWGVNWVVNSDFSFKTWPPHVLVWKNISWFLTPDFDHFWYRNNPSHYDNWSVELQKMMYEEGTKDLAKYYPIELAGGFNTVKWEYIQRINEGILFNYYVLIKPKSGYYWSDGTNDAKYIKMRLFCSSEVDVGAKGVIGETYYLSNIKKFNALKVDDGLPANIWVHNGLAIVKNVLTKPTFQENQKVIENIVKPDLISAFPNYNIEISDIFSASPNYPYNYYGTWRYKIKFISKTNPSYSKTINGYFFTI